ncbi:cofactor-independent phosphoglycerate mutase [bacterium]|nr:MAG: cofactor-independent phosphoglycerate mutase [bacterium]
MTTNRKHIILLGDGMSDRPVPELGGETPLEAASTPNMDRVASGGVVGLSRTIPEGMALGSDVANLSVLGYDPQEVYTGRSPIEAAGMGVQLGPDDVAFRCNLVTLARAESSTTGETDLGQSGVVPDLTMVDFAGGHPSDDEAHSLIGSLSDEVAGGGIEFHPGVSYRHLMVWRNGLDDLDVEPPHDLTDQPLSGGWPKGKAAHRILDIMNRSVKVFADHPVNRERKKAGRKPVNSVWLWGQGKRPSISLFQERYGLSGAMITAVDLLRGLGASLGFRVIDVPGATGYLDTNYAGKAAASLDALNSVDLVYLHVEAPDEAGHGGSLENKMKAIEDFDGMVVGPVLDGLQTMGPFRVLVMPDHATPLEIKTHSGDPVPFAALDSEHKGAGSGGPYSEKTARSSGLVIERGHELMGMFIDGSLWNTSI